MSSLREELLRKYGLRDPSEEEVDQIIRNALYDIGYEPSSASAMSDVDYTSGSAKSLQISYRTRLEENPVMEDSWVLGDRVVGAAQLSRLRIRIARLAMILDVIASIYWLTIFIAGRFPRILAYLPGFLLEITGPMFVIWLGSLLGLLITLSFPYISASILRKRYKPYPAF